MKRAMAVQQVFIYMIAGLSFAFILIFGVNMVQDLMAKGEQVEFMQFKTNLENNVKKIYSDFGAARTLDFSLPVKYSEVCFVDMDADYDESLCAKSVIACDAWETAGSWDDADQNVFLDPPAPAAIRTYKLRMDGGYMCVPVVNGKFTLRLEGRGNAAYLSQLVYE